MRNIYGIIFLLCNKKISQIAVPRKSKEIHSYESSFQRVYLIVFWMIEIYLLTGDDDMLFADAEISEDISQYLVR